MRGSPGDSGVVSDKVSVGMWGPAFLFYRKMFPFARVLISEVLGMGHFFFLFFFNFLFIDLRERNIDVLSHPFMHPLVVSCMRSDQRLIPKSWCIRMTL